MSKIGMSTEDLFLLAISKHLEISSEMISKTFDDFNTGKIKKEVLEINLNIAQSAAIFKTVATMIEENNNTVVKQLKDLNLI